MKRLLLFLIGSCVVFVADCQRQSTNNDNCSTSLRSAISTGVLLDSLFVITLSGDKKINHDIVKIPGVTIVREYTYANVFIAKINSIHVLDFISHHPSVVFVDRFRKPVEELAVSNLDLGTNRVNALHRYFPFINGNGVTVSVKENRFDTSDIDFKGRYLHTNRESAVTSNHASIMATIIAGGGNSFYEGRGVADGAIISSADFINLLPEPDAFYQQYGISVQNHSYGTTIENFYGADALAYDASVMNRPFLTHVFSAGNSGTASSTSGIYAGITGYANITGSFKMAKNIITVGHTDSFYHVLPASSKGPAYDGRVRPSLVAFAEDGSSGAAAIVSGIALTVQQTYKNITGNYPAAALVRALLFNTAEDVGSPGIDYKSGYGSMNGYRAVNETMTHQWLNSSVSHGATQIHSLTVPPNMARLRITISWDDLPAAANASTALVNDLDMTLFQPATSETWRPWVLSSYPHPDSLSKLPVRRIDHLNNAEQITIDNPVAGNYEIKVNGFNVTTATQNYSIAWGFDTLNKFVWTYPTKDDNIISGISNALRWQSTLASTTGTVEYSIDQGATWRLISNSANLSSGYQKWNAPDTFVTAIARVTSGAQQFVSEPFTISRRVNLNVGFNCQDSFALYWNRIPGVNSYKIYRLGAQYMELFMQTSDTLVVLQKSTQPSLYYAMAPVIGNLTGLRTYAYDYTSQGVGCYIKSFLASLQGNSGLLNFELGTTYGVKSITFEKLIDGQFVAIHVIDHPGSTSLQYIDNNLLKGLNSYRVKIELLNGQIIYSGIEQIFFFANSDYLVYPNPTTRESGITIVNKIVSLFTLQVFNITGQKVYEAMNDAFSQQIPAGRLSAGLYVLYVRSEEGKTERMKLLVR